MAAPEFSPQDDAPGLDPGQFATVPGKRNLLTRRTRQLLGELDESAVRSGRLSPLSYHLTMSHGHRFLWFRVAKVATRTMLDYLGEHTRLDVEHANRVRYPLASFEDYFAFAFVRHPVDRFVSSWRNKVVATNHFRFDDATRARMQRIEEFVAWCADQDLTDIEGNRHILLQVRLVDLTRVDFVGRLERFDDDFAEVCRILGIPARRVEALNRSEGDLTARDLSPAVLARIQEIYRRDHQVLGYE